MKQTARRPDQLGVKKDRSSSARRRARLSLRFRAALIVSFLLPLLCLIIIRAAGVPLGGAGALVYLFSQFTGLRLIRAFPLVPLAMGIAGVIWILSSAQMGGAVNPRRWLALLLAAMPAIGIAISTFLIPPAPLIQHVFNMTSYSQDGAFDAEARLGLSPRQYLQQFDHRLTLEVSEMRGTRVLSNPPGTVLIAMAVRHCFPAQTNPVGWIERILLDDYGTSADELALQSGAVRFAIALQSIWLVSGIFLYLLGRQFLSPAGAVLFALIAGLNPSTANFVPGKDPAQLLTIALMLWLWLVAWKRTGIASWIAATGSGIIFVVGLAFGLIHFWIALAMVAACVWHDARRHRLLRASLRCAIFAAIGVSLMLVIVRVALGWNMIPTLWSVARRFSSLQSEAMHYNRVVWLLIGLPIFLLFLSPGFWVPAWLMLTRRRASSPQAVFARRLMICTLVVMGITYVSGVAYELPRLWVAFLPLLSLAPLIRWPMAIVSSPRARRVLAVLAIAQILFTAIHVCMMDARETEWRIATLRGYS